MWFVMLVAMATAKSLLVLFVKYYALEKDHTKKADT